MASIYLIYPDLHPRVTRAAGAVARVTTGQRTDVCARAQPHQRAERKVTVNLGYRYYL